MRCPPRRTMTSLDDAGLRARPACVANLGQTPWFAEAELCPGGNRSLWPVRTRGFMSPPGPGQSQTLEGAVYEYRRRPLHGGVQRSYKPYLFDSGVFRNRHLGVGRKFKAESPLNRCNNFPAHAPEGVQGGALLSEIDTIFTLHDCHITVIPPLRQPVT